MHIQDSLPPTHADPAVIDVTVDLGTPPEGTQRLGAGRTFGYVEVLEDTVELYCPATGIPDPVTNWYILQPGPNRGRAMRVLLNDTAGKYLVRDEVVNGVMARTLTILSFSNEDVGTYVCGTSNIAGSDSGYVALMNGNCTHLNHKCTNANTNIHSGNLLMAERRMVCV